MGRPLVLLGPSWALFARSLIPLGRSLVLLGPSCALCGRSLVPLGVLWGAIGPSTPEHIHFKKINNFGSDVGSILCFVFMSFSERANTIFFHDSMEEFEVFAFQKTDRNCI